MMMPASEDQPHSLPGVLTMAKTAAAAVANEAKAIAAGKDGLDEKEIARRLALCHRCELFIPAQMRCSRCGCYMQFKARMRSQHCPVGKW